ncbi:AAA family ATPase [Sphingomonas sp. LHG3443-2]|uniref:AAA family ATPase n=1 Tax=Sphingomonas sp. LHG3443-2 TaxID=2804639 RepID=UPI003CF656DB
MNQQETARAWRLQGREAEVQLYLSAAEGDVGALIGARVLGLPLSLNIVPVSDWIDASDLGRAAVAVVQVDADSSASVKRFERLVASVSDTPVIAAAFEPPLALVRSLLRSGAHDVLPLPLSLDDLETSIAPLAQQVQQKEVQALASSSRLVTFCKARGGSGATAIASQLACRFAAREAAAGREACLLDLDVQFGDVAFQLGLHPKFSLSDAIAAGVRLDGELLRSITTRHPSGLSVLSAPEEMLPLEALNNDQVLGVVERAQRAYGTVFVDLPANWTHWSLSLAARSDLILMIADLSVAGLRQARRQLDLLEEQDLGNVPLEIVLNRYEKSLFGSVKQADAVKALGRESRFTVANDPATITGAIERGVTVDEIKRRSAFGSDLDRIDKALVSLLGRER